MKWLSIKCPTPVTNWQLTKSWKTQTTVVQDQVSILINGSTAHYVCFVFQLLIIVHN